MVSVGGGVNQEAKQVSTQVEDAEIEAMADGTITRRVTKQMVPFWRERSHRACA